jgi:hypothetical protein
MDTSRHQPQTISPDPAAIFDAIHALVDERLRRHAEPLSAHDDDAIVKDLVAYARGVGAIDNASSLAALVRFARQSELKDVANEIAILAFEKYGQPLRLLPERVEEVPS